MRKIFESVLPANAQGYVSGNKLEMSILCLQIGLDQPPNPARFALPPTFGAELRQCAIRAKPENNFYFGILGQKRRSAQGVTQGSAGCRVRLVIDKSA